MFGTTFLLYCDNSIHTLQKLAKLRFSDKNQLATLLNNAIIKKYSGILLLQSSTLSSNFPQGVANFTNIKYPCFTLTAPPLTPTKYFLLLHKQGHILSSDGKLLLS